MAGQRSANLYFGYERFVFRNTVRVIAVNPGGARIVFTVGR
jgi:hypothetical protein